MFYMKTIAIFMPTIFNKILCGKLVKIQQFDGKFELCLT